MVANFRSPLEKIVEKRMAIGIKAHADSLDALNTWLEQRCQELWREIPHGAEPGSIADVWAGEAEDLMPLGRPFDGFVEYTKRVLPTCLVHLERNRYSVPASFANRLVSLGVYPDRFNVAAEGQIICEHQRLIHRGHDGPGHTIYDWRHYLAILQRKPGALRNGSPFVELPGAFRRLQQHLRRVCRATINMRTRVNLDENPVWGEAGRA